MAPELGYLDTNLFVHALYPQDVQYARCRAIIADLEHGTATGWLDPLVIHELTYVLLNLRRFSDRAAVERYLRGIVRNPGVQSPDRDILLGALARWASRGGSTPGSRSGRWSKGVVSARRMRATFPTCQTHSDPQPGSLTSS